MAVRILVAYATKYGSTQEVAEAIAATLRDNGLEVDVQPAGKVRSVDDYGAVVLGAPLFMFHWHKDALSFLARFRQALNGRPVAVFAGGPIDARNEKGLQEAHEQLDKELAGFPWLKPFAVGVFGGKYDPAKVRFPTSLFFKGIPATDLRDWTAIRAWASEVARKLRAE